MVIARDFLCLQDWGSPRSRWTSLPVTFRFDQFLKVPDRFSGALSHGRLLLVMVSYPRCSMYGIFTYMNGWFFMVNVGKSAIHWASGYILFSNLKRAKTAFLRPLHLIWFTIGLLVVGADLTVYFPVGEMIWFGSTGSKLTHNTCHWLYWLLLPPWFLAQYHERNFFLVMKPWEWEVLVRNRRHVEVEDVLQLQPTLGPSLNIKLPKCQDGPDNQI